MKRLFVLLLIVVMGLSLFACGDSGNSSGAPSPKESLPSEVNLSPEPSATPEEIEETAATVTDSGAVGDYNLSILGYALTTDYNGESAIVVDFDFTNNSEENAAFLYSIKAKAFQDGVELSDAIVIDTSVYDAEAYTKEIQPGATLTCQRAFVLTSQSPVQVDVSELITFENTGSLTKTFEIAE